MAVEDPPWALQADSHPAAVVRHSLAGIMGAPVGAFAGGVQPTTAGGGHGVMSPGSMAVSQSGTPGMSVVVAAGQCVVRGTESNNQGCYSGYNDADATLVIATADGTNPRNDLICFQIRDAAFSGANNDARLVVVQGTPNAVPADPSLSTTPNALVLARVRVNALASSITNANITDLRPQARALGGVVVCNSTNRPTGGSLYPGLFIYEPDTLRQLHYDGSTWWVDVAAGTYTPTTTNFATGTGGGAFNQVNWRLNSGQLFLDWNWVMGSSGGSVTSNPTISLPAGFTADNTGTLAYMPGTTYLQGSFGPARTPSTTTLEYQVWSASGTYVGLANISSTVPVTWAAGNAIRSHVVISGQMVG